MFVQATPEGQLMSRIQDICDNSGFKTKVVEKSGRNVKQLLQRGGVASSSVCNRDDCSV